MNYLKQSSVVVLTLLLTACGATEHKQAAQPAVLGDASAQARSVINTTISNALGGTKVTVAKNAFVSSDKLVLQRATRDPLGMKGLNGRLLGRPVLHRFSMVKQNGSCYLIREKTTKRYLLNGVSCRSLNPL